MRLSISLKQLAVLAPIVAAMYMAFAWVVSPRIPNSRYHRHDLALLQRRIQMQRTTGLRALQQYRSKVPGPVFARPSARQLCVGIASVARKDQPYLEQTVASLLTRVPLSYQDRIRITLYNLDDPPAKHTVARALASTVAVETPSFRTVDPDVPITRANIKTKEFLDYIVLLEREQQHGCSHYLILEDDVLAARHWADKVFDVIRQMGAAGGDYSVVKLFCTMYTGREQWSWTCWHDWLVVPALALLIGGLLYGTMLLAARAARCCARQTPDQPEKPQDDRLWGRLGEFNLASCLVVLASILGWVVYVQRGLFIYPRAGLMEYDNQRQYPAVLYTADGLDRWVTFMTQVYRKCQRDGTAPEPKDVYVDAFIQEQHRATGRHYKPMIYTPNIFQHTGIHSSIGNGNGGSLRSAALSYTYPDDDEPLIFDAAYVGAPSS